MLYQIVPARIENDGQVKESKRRQMFQTPQHLELGGLYFLRPGKLYRVVERVDTGEG